MEYSGIEEIEALRNATMPSSKKQPASLLTKLSGSPAWELRRATLLRALYPHAAPPRVVVKRPPTSDESIGKANQLILRPLTTAAPSVPLEKPRKRDRDSMAVIPIDPEILKAQSKAQGAFDVPKRSKWKLQRVVGGHEGRVRTLCFEPSGEWFASGATDGIIKVWDLATGYLKVNLTGHKETVRGLAMSHLSPYMFSCSEDHTVRCWDLEQNQVVREFHGHLSAVNCVAAHPKLDVLFSGGRDATVRVWDVRTRQAAHVMQGHSESVLCLAAQASEPQVVSGGADCFIYLWDVAQGKPFTRLTRHKKPVRSIVLHPVENAMASCGADNVRKWRLPDGEFFCNMNNMASAPEAGLWCCCALSPHDVFFVGAENGLMRFYDWGSHSMFQYGETTSAEGTLSGEGGVLCCSFDVSGRRLITGEGDKTLKLWREIIQQ